MVDAVSVGHLSLPQMAISHLRMLTILDFYNITEFLILLCSNMKWEKMRHSVVYQF